jgi:predicted ribosome quality control (RQC) complex YloA/Tae2 family protein
MVKIKIDLTKSIEENAGIFFEKSKKAKKKLQGALEALKRSQENLEKLKKEQKIEKERLKEKKPERKKQWYEKFHWFYSSEGFLCIGGRDATSNEIVIKKHTDKDDIVFHTEVSGSPFFVVKTEGRTPGQATLNEAAQATVTYSKAWKLGVASIEVFYVAPSQVTKEAKPGEFVPRGAFMIYGKKNYIPSDISLAVGIKGSQVIGGPVDAVKANADKFVIVKQGRQKTAAAAKKIRQKLGSGDLDDIIRMIPAGGCETGG